MMQVAHVAVCSQIYTKHIKTVWAEHTVVECSSSWCITQPASFKKVKRGLKMAGWMYLMIRNSAWPSLITISKYRAV
jgi:hypothetical protein